MRRGELVREHAVVLPTRDPLVRRRRVRCVGQSVRCACVIARRLQLLPARHLHLLPPFLLLTDLRLFLHMEHLLTALLRVLQVLFEGR